MLEGHGDDAWKYQRPIDADFSSNVWHGGLNAQLQQHLQTKIATITHYPEVDARTVQAEAAGTYGLAPEQVLVTNGATEAIYLIAQAFFGGSATVLTPAFAEYEDACRMHRLQVRLQAWETVKTDDGFATDLVFVCNPNNPTGLAFPLASLQELLRHNPQSLFIIDESYIEFTGKTSSLLPFLADHPNTLILRSLTKSCCIPGLRIGFVLGQVRQVDQLRRLKMPWSVNQLAIEAASYIFHHPQQFVLPLLSLLEATADWREVLQTATRWRVLDTDTHYFLMETPAGFSAAQLKQYLVTKHGLLIRDAANFRGLTAQHFRIACQAPEQNQLLTDALHRCSQTGL
jgi:threonine-phosphate decarboxylase